MLKATYDAKSGSLYIIDCNLDHDPKGDLLKCDIEDTEPCESMNGVFFDKNSDGKIIGIEVLGIKLEMK